MKILKLLFLILASIPLSHHAQSTFNSWNRAGFKYEKEKSHYAISRAFRYSTLMPGLDKSFTEYRLGRNIAWLSYTCGLRFIGDHDNKGNKQGTDYEFRLHHDFKFKTIINEHKLNHRIRYQTLRYNLEDIRDSRNQWRYKMAYKWKIKNWKLDPTFAGELFIQTKPMPITQPNRFRLYIATDYKLTDSHSIELEYMYEKDRANWIAYNHHIFRLNYQFQIQKK